MDPNLEQRLLNIEKKVDDTYKIVRKMRGAQKRAVALKIAYWALIIILGFVAVEAVRPYLEQLTEAYGNVTQTSSSYADLLKTLNQ